MSPLNYFLLNMRHPSYQILAMPLMLTTYHFTDIEKL